MKYALSLLQSQAYVDFCLVSCHMTLFLEWCYTNICLPQIGVDDRQTKEQVGEPMDLLVLPTGVRVRGCLPEHVPLKGWCSTEKPTSIQVTIPLLETGTLAFSVTSRQFQESLPDRSMVGRLLQVSGPPLFSAHRLGKRPLAHLAKFRSFWSLEEALSRMEIAAQTSGASDVCTSSEAVPAVSLQGGWLARSPDPVFYWNNDTGENHFNVTVKTAGALSFLIPLVFGSAQLGMQSQLTVLRNHGMLPLCWD